MTLNEGNSFGELSLIDDVPRYLTVVCDTECTFAVIFKERYKKTFEKIEKRNLEERVKFFRGMTFI